MAQTNDTRTGLERWQGIGPWLGLLAGVVACGMAGVMAGTALEETLFQGLLLGGGLIAVGAAVTVRLRHTGWNFSQRSATAGFVALALVPCLLAHAALPSSWDSFRFVLNALGLLAIVGAVLLLLPTVPRKIAISLVVVFHFGGIFTAVLSAPPPQGPSPWLARTLWMHVYRPYLLFLYLNNAYHFYAPEPGPSYQFWFHLTYPDGSPSRWVRLPFRDQFATKQQYLRRIALTDSLAKPGDAVSPILLEELGRRRVDAGDRYQIPLHPDVQPQSQYIQPQANVRMLIPSYARHIIHNYPSETNPDVKAVAVKVYRATHTMLDPYQFTSVKPDDPTLFMPFFMGDFDASGKLLNPDDPFLYWLIPILYTRDGKPDGAVFRRVESNLPDAKLYKVCDYTERQALLQSNRLR